jgi:WD40 repeat protein
MQPRKTTTSLWHGMSRYLHLTVPPNCCTLELAIQQELTQMKPALTLFIPWQDQKLVQKLAGHGQMVKALDTMVDTGVLVSCSFDKTVRTWSPAEN